MTSMEILKTIDYTDCFEGQVNISPPPTMRKVVYLFLSDWPGWVKALFVMRNLLVWPFGLLEKGESIFNTPKPDIKWTPDGHVGFFNIAKLTEDELVLYARAKHLDACLIFSKESNGDITKVAVKTDVSYNNTLGWWYFNIIKPFHVFIIITQIKRTIKSLQK
jgi:hypothetical protein